MNLSPTSSTVPKKVFYYVLSFIFLLAISLTLYSALSPARRSVFLPAITALIIAVAFFIILFRWSGNVPLDEIGFWIVGVVTLYTIYPLVIYLKDFAFNDWRFVYIYQPKPGQVSRWGWIYVAYLAFFALFYLIGRRRQIPSPHRQKSLGKHSVVVAIGLFLTIEIFLFLLGRFYPLSVSSYYESFLVFRRLPMLLQQIVTKLNGIQFVVIVLLLSFLFSSYRRWRWLIWGWLCLEIIIKFKQQLGVGSNRTWLMLIFVAVITLYHIRVKPISLKFFFLAGAVVLSFFLILGFIRQNIVAKESGGFGIFNRNSEFEVIFSNAYDVRERIKAGDLKRASLGFYLADFTALVPQQLLPFPKVDMSNWYLLSLYPTIGAQGGGLAFGVIAQSYVGQGFLELILRAALLGYLFGKTVRFYRRHSGNVWVLIGYVFLICVSYQTFRVSTFYPLVQLEYQFLPVWLMVSVGGYFLKSTLHEAKTF